VHNISQPDSDNDDRDKWADENYEDDYDDDEDEDDSDYNPEEDDDWEIINAEEDSGEESIQDDADFVQNDSSSEEDDDQGSDYEDEALSSAKRRARYVLALKATALLFQAGKITDGMRSSLKDLVLDNDRRVFAAVELYEVDDDEDEMMDTLFRIAKITTK